jgi:hypothetical protein
MPTPPATTRGATVVEEAAVASVTARVPVEIRPVAVMSVAALGSNEDPSPPPDTDPLIVFAVRTSQVIESARIARGMFVIRAPEFFAVPL